LSYTRIGDRPSKAINQNWCAVLPPKH